MRVLLVDDHAMVRQAVRKLLEREADIQVVGEASDGREGVALAGQLQPEIVLMNVRMPLMNGIEATAAICAAHPNTGVIGLSFYTDAEVADAIRHAGAVGYVSKTGAPDALIGVLRGAYRGRKNLPPAMAA
jgi:DNA-binding NarL/FixJ family response regulator